MKSFISLDIGGSKIMTGIFDDNSNLLYKDIIETPRESDEKTFVNSILETCRTIISNPHAKNLQAISIAIASTVKNNAVVIQSPNIPVNNLNLKAIIEEEFGILTIIENDVNLALYGNWKRTKAKEKNVIALFVGTGIGGAAIINGELYTSFGLASEFGHMKLANSNIPCNCGGFGCLEAYSSKTGIKNEFIRLKDRLETSIMKSEIQKNSPINNLAFKEALVKKDDLSIEIFDRAIDYLAIGISNLVNIFNPELLILGGGIVDNLHDLFMPRLLEKIRENSMKEQFDSMRIDLADSKGESGIYGAYFLVKDKYFNNYKQ